MLTQGFLKKKYNQLAICTFLGWLVSLVGDLSDSILAGLFISEDAVSAVELVNPIFGIVFFLSAFISAGGNVLYSRAAGEFDKEKCRRVAGTCVVLSVLSGVIMLLVMWLMEDVYFKFYSATAEIETLARSYYECFFILVIVFPVYYAIYYLICADGDSGLLLIVDIVNAIGNAALSLILVQNHGIAGLAWGTIGATVLSVLIMLIHFVKKSNGIHFKLCLQGSYVVQMFAIGSSASLNYLYLAVVDIVMNKAIITMFGARYLPAYAVVNLILNFEGCFSSGIGGASSFISISYGEGNPVGQKKSCDYAAKTTLILGVALCVLAELMAEAIPGFYGISDPEIFAASVYTSRVLGFSYLFGCAVVALADYYSRINKVFLGNVMVAINMLIAPLVCALPLAKAFGYKGLVWGFFLPVVLALLFNFVYVWFKYGIKKFPYILPDTDDAIFIHELALEPEQIHELTGITKAELESCNVDEDLINKILLVMEDTFMLVRDKNKKSVLADSTLLVNDERIQLITRDAGLIFDITDTDADISSFREYVVARLMTAGQENIYLTTTSFNRNSYIWKR